MQDHSDLYGGRFYAGQRHSSLQSARLILPAAFDLLRPHSVVDVGCGVGTWLAAAGALGAERRVGIEGPWVRREALEDHGMELVTHDLENPLPLGERFDLAISLEVAEHLSPGRADSLVEELCALSDVVLFGAAIPGQGGVNHIHERWQGFWMGLFQARGYVALDIIRPRFWGQVEIPVHYRQNTFLYIHRSREELLALFPGSAAGREGGWPVNLAHPEVYLSALEELERPPTLGMALATTARLPIYLVRSLRHRLGLATGSTEESGHP